MKISTINTIYWVAIATFWALFISDLVIPGDAPKSLEFARYISVYVFLSAQFYVLGFKRAVKRSPGYQANFYEKSN